MMIVGTMLTSAAPAQAATLPMFKQSETVTISREEYENYQRYQKLETLFQIVEAYYYEDVDEDAMLESAAVGLMAASATYTASITRKRKWKSSTRKPRACMPVSAASFSPIHRIC